MKKNKKLMLGIMIIVLITIICVLIAIKVDNKNIIQKQSEKSQKLTETSEENSFVTTKTHLAEVNDSVTKLTEFKSAIANAITEMGVETLADADTTTMTNNIKNISKSSVSIVATGSGNTSFTLDSINMTDTDVNNYILQPYYAPSESHYAGWIDQDNQYPYVSGFTASLTISDGTITISGMQVTGGHSAAPAYTTVNISWRLYHIS